MEVQVEEDPMKWFITCFKQESLCLPSSSRSSHRLRAAPDFRKLHVPTLSLSGLSFVLPLNSIQADFSSALSLPSVLEHLVDCGLTVILHLIC